MPFNTLTVGAAVTPGVIETYFSHYLNRRPLRQKPTAHISYHEGLQLVRHFLEYASRHKVEDVQAFTAQYVPSPTWVRLDEVDVTEKYLQNAVGILHDHFGSAGLEKIGGKTWWQWRRPGSSLRAEWIEMKKDYNQRKRSGAKSERIIFYIHGGAYYFGSVGEHRYQMQRHARKLKARVLAPRYRLAPQFPFPCGLLDCLATYLFLLEQHGPSHIIVAGDSAGGGMALSMLCVLRDQKQPLPAGTILLSPWVDLTHSFPSLAEDPSLDYIPPWGFVHRPSMAWPPAARDTTQPKATNIAETGIEKDSPPGQDHNLKITLDGKEVELKEQIQMYAHNGLLSHPLVSPVMQPSLGGLPPMLIQTGGGELLRDEQIYIAHKAANPKAYPASDAIYAEYDPDRRSLDEYPPTYVQLQVWEDLCHVAHTLSFTRPAKYMYRSVAQFGAWALAHAQNKGIEIQNDDSVSVISSDEDEDDDFKSSGSSDVVGGMNAVQPKQASVGKAGDPLPQFREYMIRQRVTRHGVIYPLAPTAELPALNLDPASIGAIKPGPVRKWLAAKAAHDVKFAGEWKKVQARREKEKSVGYEDVPGEHPPPTALAGRRRTGMASEEKKKHKSWGLALWSGWGSNHDEQTLEREEEMEQSATTDPNATGEDAPDGPKQEIVVPEGDGRGRAGKRRTSASSSTKRKSWSRSKHASRSPYEQVRDRGQANGIASILEQQQQLDQQSTPVPAATQSEVSASQIAQSANGAPLASVPTMAIVSPESEKLEHTENTFLSPTSTRPHNGTVVYPFKLRSEDRSASTATLNSVAVSAVASTTGASAAGDTTPTESSTKRFGELYIDNGNHQDQNTTMHDADITPTPNDLAETPFFTPLQTPM